MTRFAMPVLAAKGRASPVAEHFARSEHFALVEARDDRIVSVKVVRVAPADDKKKAEYLAEKGVEVVLAGRIGACMTRILLDRGVRVYSGAEGTVRAAYEAYRAGALVEVQPNPYQL